MKTRLDWSRKRVITLVAAAAVTTLILGYTAERLLEDASLHQAVWLAAFANIIQWCGYLATTLRDEMRQDQQDMREKLVTTLRETIRTEVAELLKPIDSKIEEIDADVHSFGDQREAAGIAIGAKIVGQRGGGGSRHLNLVD
jgi:hypothetical protein